MDFQQKIFQLARQQDLISPGDRILVAVSGGPDSVALLHLLYEIQDELQLHLEVAHMQHGLRGKESLEDACFVANLAQKLDLPFFLKEVDLPQLKFSAGKGNLEAWGRALRYQFFADTVRLRALDKVATAHTRDDQAETVLMWVLRGSGMKGLGGMAPLHQIQQGDQEQAFVVIRPLLEVAKGEVLEYLREKDLEYRVDRTNQDTALLRNWIRQELLPTLQRRTGENISLRLSRQAKLLRDDDEQLNRIAAERYAALLEHGRIDRRRLLREPKALQRRILRLWIEALRGHLSGLDFVHVEELLRLIGAKGAHGRLSIPGGWELVCEYDALRLEQRSRVVKPHCYSYGFEIGTHLNIPEAKLELHSMRISPPVCGLPTTLSEAWFDLDLLAKPMWVRNFRAGDRIQPLNLLGHRKVKDLFIDRKVPLSIRATVPLLIADKDVLWIPGYARSELARVSLKTRSILQIKAVSISG